MKKKLDLAEIYLIDNAEGRGAALTGKNKFKEALQSSNIKINYINHLNQFEENSRSFCIIIGLSENQIIKKILRENKIEVEKRAEGIFYQKCTINNKEIIIIGGTDERGLLYGLYEIAARLASKGIEALATIENTLQYPEIEIRGANRFVMGPLDDKWFYSSSFWEYYLEMLAEYRYNRFVLITGFDTGYLSPPYPFFVEVPGFPDVRVKGLETKQRDMNLQQLITIGQLCKKYGLQFFFATWQQTPWTENQQQMVAGLVENENELSSFCANGLKRLLEKCPLIDGVQLRVNLESGVGGQETAQEFWKRIIKAVAEVGRDRSSPIRLALRAKGLTDQMIEFAENLGLDLEIPTKYWCEHSGLPYHLTQMRQGELNKLDNLNHSRRYSYADLLKKPFLYDMVYRLWNFGSSNILLWGDPDYARRFMASIKAGQGAGYEIAAPLSLQGGRASIQEKSWSLFKKDSFKFFEWEDERYWFWYLVFGRLGYSSSTNADVWQRELKKRTGNNNYLLLEKVYRAASKIIPLVTAFHMPRHPALIYWTELSTGGALFAENNYNKHFGERNYINSEGSDPGLFYRIDEYVEDVLAGRLQGKYAPGQVKKWLIDLAESVAINLEQLERELEKSPGENEKNSEVLSTILDFNILKDLAFYHAHKIQAAVNLCFFQNTDDYFYLKKAEQALQIARDHWQKLSDRSEGIYHDDLNFGTGIAARRGHWKDRLVEFEKDQKTLKNLLANKKEDKSNTDNLEKEINSNVENMASLQSFSVEIPEVHSADSDLIIEVKTGEPDKFTDLTLHYRNMNQLQGQFKKLAMEKMGDFYQGRIKADYLSPEWDLMIYFSFVAQGNSLLYPGIFHAEHPFPYLIVRVTGPDGDIS